MLLRFRCPFRAEIIAQGTILARDVMNERSDVANPAFFESLAREVRLLLLFLELIV